MTQQQTTAINFDSLFPNSPYKRAFDTSMCLVGDIQELQLKNKETKHFISVDVTDFLLGKVVRLKLAIDSIEQQNFTLLSEDLEYLKGSMRFIDAGLHTLFFDNNDESVQLITDIIAYIQRVLEGEILPSPF